MHYWLKISVLLCACIGVNAPILGAAIQSEIKQKAQQKKSCTLADVQKKYADELSKQEQALIGEFCALCKITPDYYYARLKQNEGRYAEGTKDDIQEAIKKYGPPKKQSVVYFIEDLLKKNDIDPAKITLVSTPEELLVASGTASCGMIEYNENYLVKLPSSMGEAGILHEIAHLKNKDSLFLGTMDELIGEKGLSKDQAMEELRNRAMLFTERRANVSVFVRGPTYAKKAMFEFSKEGTRLCNDIIGSMPQQLKESLGGVADHEGDEGTYKLAKQIYEEIKGCTE
jgi:hypothetical protein